MSGEGGSVSLGRGLTDDHGQITVFVVVITALVVLFAGLAVDGGLALATKIRALGEAQEAARAGAQAIDLDAYRADGTVRLQPDQARALAYRYLATTGDTGTVTATERTVTVAVTVQQPTQLLQAAGLDTLTVTGSGTARPRHGVSAPER
ncbi:MULTISPECIES: TadE/TadG family type IV pilus assembly protein [Streptomyces]|uniref:Putative Flp pilus-assembly TadG-like N-terminal domain-containing protein n=2 Tax=Streptomyces rhizosphaericus TaxID=114699 RepID=A0ABN1S540_9ACTN|nr:MULTISPECIES: pilus assembly protein TadG-related protein [Streptomyces]